MIRLRNKNKAGMLLKCMFLLEYSNRLKRLSSKHLLSIYVQQLSYDVVNKYHDEQYMTKTIFNMSRVVITYRECVEIPFII